MKNPRQFKFIRWLPSLLDGSLIVMFVITLIYLVTAQTALVINALPVLLIFSILALYVLLRGEHSNHRGHCGRTRKHSHDEPGSN